jgi:WD40 repeat protein/tRNA A-37 threonylcarbamoyl transferase component Bud32
MAILDRECSADEELRRQVETLLEDRMSHESYRGDPFVDTSRDLKHDGPPREEDADAATLKPTDFMEAPADSSFGPAPDPNVATRAGAVQEIASRAFPDIPGYEILGELGRGGMGVVYKVRPSRLNRVVALKMILAGDHASPETVKRFLAEAEAVALLQSPNVVQIFHIDECGGRPYFVMEYVSGGSLSSRLDGTPRASEEAVGLIEPLCRAVHEAHRLGLVHRDLKPANVLLARDGTPKIADFGLVKLLGVDSGLTQTETILGSPSYMAPEQAEGKTKDVGPAADIYALGAMLYELLTGRPPFRAATVLQTLEQVKYLEPVSPSRLQPGLARDLETICLKCLQKEPSRRYATAADLAEDLERWQAGVPISARPVPFWERGWRWARRRPAVAALGALLLLISGVSFVLVAALWARALERAEAAILARDRADRLAGEETEARQAAQIERAKAVDSLYRSLVREARALRLARSTGYRARVWDLIKQAMSSGAGARDVDELRREAVACMGDFAGSAPRIWPRLPSGVFVTALAAHPDPSKVALGLSDGTVSIRSLPGGEELARFTGHDAQISDVAFDAHGSGLISADASGSIKVWARVEDDHWIAAATIAADRPTRGYRTGRPISVALAPDGKTFAACAALGTSVSLWDVASGVSAGRLSVPSGEQLTCLALSPDGKHLGAGYRGPGRDGVLIWDLAARQLKHTLAPQLELVLGITFSPGGRWIGCACSEGVALFDTAQFQRRLFVRGDFPTGVAFSPDEQVLAVPAEKLGALRLWDIAVNREVAVLDCPRANGAVAFSPDGRYLIASNHDAVRLWTPWATDEKLTLSGHIGGIPGVAVNRGGTLVASAGKDRSVRIWDAASGRLLKTLTAFRGPVQAVAFGTDESRLVTAEFNGELRIWHVASSQGETLPDPGLGRPLWSINFTPDGGYFWAQGSPQTAIWQVRSAGGVSNGQAGTRLELHRVLANTNDACLSPDGDRLASSASDKLEVFGIRDDTPIFSVPYSHPGGATHLAFNPDGRRLVSINRRYEVQVWDTAIGRNIATFGGDPGRTSNSTMALSPGGDWLAEANRAVTIWDMRRRRPVLILPETRNIVWSMAWLPGQNRLVAGTSDGELVIWDLDRVRSHLVDLSLDQ